VVLAKRRDLQAARVNKYRKVQRRLGEEAMRPDDAFDPEKYAARLEAFERAEIVKDDGFGRGKRGRIPPPVEDVEEGAARDEATVADKRGRGKRKRRGRPDDEPEGGSDSEPEGGSDSDDSDALFDNNVVEAAAPSSDEKERNDSDGDGDGDGDPLPGTSKRYSSGKGWNKTVKDQMRWEAEKKRRAEEMAELRAKWADEDAGRKRYFDARDARRGKFRKKNARGQPVMRHRVDKILERLEESDEKAGGGGVTRATRRWAGFCRLKVRVVPPKVRPPRIVVY
jgi:hypothetical protein